MPEMNPMLPATGEFPSYLRELGSLAVLRLTADGRVLDANLGFWRAIGREAQTAGKLFDVAAFLVNPPLAELRRRLAVDAPPDAALFRGLITLGDPDAVSHTLSGAIYREGDGLLLVAEHDIQDIERLAAEVLQLNGDLAEAQRALTRQNQSLHRSNQQILETARTDPLTGAANRRRFDERLQEELERLKRGDSVLSLALADVDHFKQVNDQFGHPAGDAVLKALVQTMLAGTRPYDLVARWGGEEFVILLPQTGAEAAFQVAERIRLAFAAQIVPAVNRAITVSFGIAAALPADSAETLLARADAALYRAKSGGRNRVCAAS
jgi:diguanylate cyclase (GGDEF)-like protein